MAHPASERSQPKSSPKWALGSFWWLVQVSRARLLGEAARVAPDTFPVLSRAATEVRQQLGYPWRVEIYIAGSGEPARLTRFLGTDVLIMNGDLAADLISPENRAQLDFILATFFGRLKARTLPWAPALIAVDAVRLTRVLGFLIAPWERSTVYTGDQAAAICCGSLDQSVIALNRLLVGKHLAPSVGMTGLMKQAVTVRKRWLPRLRQLYSAYPLTTNRYLNLVSFAGQWAPEQARTFCAGLKHDTELDVRKILARSARQHQRGSRRWVVPVSIAASVAMLGAAGYGVFSPASQRLLTELRREAPPPAAMSSQASSATASASPPVLLQMPSDALAALEAHVPPVFAGSCASSVPPAVTTGLVAAIACTPTGNGGPAHVEYYQYETATDMNTAFSRYAGGIAAGGSCDRGGQRGTYQFAHASAEGAWACYYDGAGTSQMIWTSSALNILASANARTLTPQQLNDWFFSPAATGPR